MRSPTRNEETEYVRHHHQEWHYYRRHRRADFAIFDPDTVGSKKRGEMWHDLPGGGRRLVMPAQGVEYTIVNGTVLYEQGQHTGALPGQVLRSGAA